MGALKKSVDSVGVCRVHLFDSSIQVWSPVIQELETRFAFTKKSLRKAFSSEGSEAEASA